MSVELVAVKPLKYRTRRLIPGQHFRVKSEREARVFVHLKKAERHLNEDKFIALDDARAEVGLPPLSTVTEDIAAVRAEYFETFERRPFNGWDIDELRRRIAAA